MELGRSSWHRRLLEWLLYEYNIDMDKINLCKYFWLCVTAFIGLPFFLIIKGIVSLVSKIADNYDAEKIKNYTKQGFKAGGVVSYFLLGIYAGWSDLLFMTGVFVVVFTVILFGVAGVAVLKDMYDEKRAGKPKKPNIIVEWIKAKKGKYCPRIEWIG